MRGLTSCCLGLALVGCKPAEKPAEMPPADAPAVEEAPAPSTPAEMVGTWHVKSTLEGSKKTVVSYDMAVTADRSGWSITFPNREPIPIRVIAIEGDSVVTEAGPFESALRKGKQVTTNNVSRLQDGKLVGTTVAHYQVSTRDSVARLSFEGTRAP